MTAAIGDAPEVGYLVSRARPPKVESLLASYSIGYLADRAEEATFVAGDHQGLRVQAIVHSAAAVLVLLVAAVLSIYKPASSALSYGAGRWSRRPPR